MRPYTIARICAVLNCVSLYAESLSNSLSVIKLSLLVGMGILHGIRLKRWAKSLPTTVVFVKTSSSYRKTHAEFLAALIMPNIQRSTSVRYSFSESLPLSSSLRSCCSAYCCMAIKGKTICSRSLME